MHKITFVITLYACTCQGSREQSSKEAEIDQSKEQVNPGLVKALALLLAAAGPGTHAFNPGLASKPGGFGIAQGTHGKAQPPTTHNQLDKVHGDELDKILGRGGRGALLGLNAAKAPITVESVDKHAAAAATPLLPSSAAEGSKKNGAKSRKVKKSVTDRTQEEAISLIQDIIQAAVDAGPQAGPVRTFQAYKAFSETFLEFLPRFGQPPSEFSAPKALRTLFEKLGATYVKLGQFVASSPTIFPKDYVLEFQKLLDKTDPVEWRIIEQVIEKDLGPISKTFEFVDTKPLASASIAQVHAAKLKTGEDVVIKVQKPGIDASLKADLSFVYVASKVLGFLQPDWEDKLSLSGVVGDIRSSMLEELDFTKEARNTEEFRRYLAQNNLLNEATAPKVYQEFTTKKVFTMERLYGVSLLDEETISKVTKDPEVGQQAIISALNIWTQSVMQMPFFHADVHAGNLLLLDDGRIGFIDFGIVGRVSDKTFKAVNELSTSLALRDYPGMAQALCNMGATDDEVDIDKFGRDIETVMNRIANVQPDITITEMADGAVGGRLDFDQSEITNLLLEIVEITEDNGLKLPREFGLLVKQSLYFDRYLKILAPELDVMSDARVSGLGEESSADMSTARVNGSA